MTEIKVVQDRNEVIQSLSRDRPIQVYGLADLELPVWIASTWWRRGAAFVGRVPLPGPEGIVAICAISPREPHETSLLLRDLRDELPDGGLVVGPRGSADIMSEVSEIERLGDHVKMTVDTEGFVPPPGELRSEVLTGADLPALLDLYASDPGAAFFLPSMLDDGLFVGVKEAGHLLAAGGTHVRSDEFNLAALGGVLTSPSARGQGLAADVTALLSRILLGEGRLVALNTHAENHTARRLYRRLGYHKVHTYTEFVLR
ncbi:MAG: ribosomal protein S18 acetylase RimI-like enzyme [Candidatus Poriferisodalaceae bacterium]|jgi:ribosomal protein S18 acetylase RimI-like enzyme